jgi:hypothetical protein
VSEVEVRVKAKAEEEGRVGVATNASLSNLTKILRSYPPKVKILVNRSINKRNRRVSL